MGIDAAFFQRIAAIGAEQGLFPGASVAILGDCTFQTSWATGDNRVDLQRFAAELGLARVETMDVFGHPTIRQDLHADIPAALTDAFDIVIDAGTLYCCFDIVAAWRNALRLLKPKGMMLHQSALIGYFGRGYYNLHPSLFCDFYSQNGFVITNLEVRVFKGIDSMQRWRRRLWFWRRGRKITAFQPLEPGENYLISADAVSLKFTAETAVFPGLVPNETQILCAAFRKEAQPFSRPLPPFFEVASKAG